MTEAIVRSSRERIQRSSTWQRPRRRLDLGGVEQDQPAGVPELVGEVAALLDLGVGVAHVLGRGHRQQAEAQRVGAVDVDLLQRVDPGAEALRHPPPVAGLDHRVDVDVAEGDVAGELEPGHDHPRHPEEEDLARGGEEAGRVEGAQLRRVVGPAERREGPDRRAEPGVEHVLLLAQLAAAGAAALGRLPRRRSVSSQASQYQTGIRCPHQSWREMHQGRISRIQSR